MYNGINFLKERSRMQELVLLRDKKIAQMTSLFLGLFLFVMVALLAFQFYLGARLNSVVAQTNDEQRKIQSLSNVQTAYLGVFNRLKTINDILKQRSNKWDAIAFFYGLLPQGASISSVDLQAQAGVNELNFSIQASNVFMYDQLSQVLQSDTVKRSGYALSLGSLSRNKDGTYRIDATLTSAATAPKATPVPLVTPAP